MHLCIKVKAVNKREREALTSKSLNLDAVTQHYLQAPLRSRDGEMKKREGKAEEGFHAQRSFKRKGDAVAIDER